LVFEVSDPRPVWAAPEVYPARLSEVYPARLSDYQLSAGLVEGLHAS
jgi:hypothetical protein